MSNLPDTELIKFISDLEDNFVKLNRVIGDTLTKLILINGKIKLQFEDKECNIKELLTELENTKENSGIFDESSDAPSESSNVPSDSSDASPKKLTGGNQTNFSETSDFLEMNGGGKKINFSETSEINGGGKKINFSETSEMNGGGKKINFSETSEINGSFLNKRMNKYLRNNMRGGGNNTDTLASITELQGKSMPIYNTHGGGGKLSKNDFLKKMADAGITSSTSEFC